MRRGRGGFTLIDLMISLAVIGLGVSIWLTTPGYRRATRRAAAVEGIARVLDQELERMRACESSRCLNALATETATTGGVALDAESWARPIIERRVEVGVSGTRMVTVTAHVPGLVKPTSASALIWVRR